MTEFQCGDHDIFGDFIGAGFDHQDGIARAGDAQVEVGFVDFGEGGVGDELAIHAPDAHGGNRTVPGDVGDHDGGGGGVDGEDVERIIGVGGERIHDDLDFVAHAFREERAQRPVGETGGQDGIRGGAAFAPEERAGDLAAGVHALFVIHAEGEEIDALADAAHGGSGKNNRIVQVDRDGSTGLRGQFAGFNGNFPAAHQ